VRSRFRVRNMNDTKWREVFALLAAGHPEVVRVTLKFVGNRHEIESGGRFRPVNDSSCDGFPGPFPYRKLEWIEVPREFWVAVGNPGVPWQVRGQEVDPFRTALQRLGRLPIVDVAAGFRIVAYQ
jgi:hypothetical protein